MPTKYCFQVGTLVVISSVNRAFFRMTAHLKLLTAAKVDDAGNQALTHSSIAKQSISVASTSLWDTFKPIYPMKTDSFIGWSITAIILPYMIWVLGIGWDNKDIEPLVAVLLYVVCDFIGRISYSKFVMKEYNDVLIYWLVQNSVHHVALHPFSHRPGSEYLIDSQYVALSYITVHALITGYIGSAQLHITGKRVADRHKVNAAYILRCSILCAQLFESVGKLLALDLEM